jgi:hypothetical protein
MYQDYLFQVSEKSENSAKDDECLSDQLEGEIKEETINGEVQLETKKEKKVKFVSEISLQNGAEKEKLNIDREQLVKVNPKNFVQRKKKFYPKDQLSKVNWESFTLVRKNMNGVIETTQSCEKTVGNEEKGNNTYENRQFQNGNVNYLINQGKASS